MSSAHRNLIVFDTATEACVVGLQVGDELKSRDTHGVRHSEIILEMIGELLNEAGIGLKQVDALGFGRGPGMFTGLRIGAGVVQGLALAADLPVAPVSTLAIIAQSSKHPDVLAAIDARMDQVYWAVYRQINGVATLSGEEQLQAPADVRVAGIADLHAAGSGWDKYAAQILNAAGGQIVGGESNVSPRADALVALVQREIDKGTLVSAAEALPVYLRDDVAQKQATS